MKKEIKYKIISIIVLSFGFGIIKSFSMKITSIVIIFSFSIGIFLASAAIWFLGELLFMKPNKEDYKPFVFNRFWIFFIVFFIITLLSTFTSK